MPNNQLPFYHLRGVGKMCGIMNESAEFAPLMYCANQISSVLNEIVERLLNNII